MNPEAEEGASAQDAEIQDAEIKDAEIQAAEAHTPETRPAPGERRLHPVTPLRRAWAPVAVGAGWAVHDPDGAYRRVSDLAAETVLLAGGALVLFACLYGFLSWWFTHFSVTDTELRIRTGLVFRRTAHIRLDRLQAVDLNQPLLARFLGVAKLKMDVIGADKKDELAYLSEPDARALRAELLARAAGFAPEHAREVGEAPAAVLLHVPPKMLAISLALSGGMWAWAVTGIAVPVGLWFLTHSLPLVIGTGIPLLGAAGASSVGRFIKEYDWTVGASQDGLRLDHGLLDKAHETVPPGRVQTVHIVEPLLWRRRGWVRIELDVAGSSNDVLVPVAPREIAEAVIERILPGVVVPSGLSRPPASARWCVPLWWRGYGLAVTETVFAARHGRLSRKLSLVPHAKVQSVRLSQGPWMRLHGVADIHVETGANTSVAARLRSSAEASELLESQAERSRTGRREARPDRWMAGEGA